MKQDKYTAVIIDDEQAAQEVLKRLLSEFEEIKIVGTANDGIDGQYLLEKKQPDLAFVDIDMPRKNGVELLKDLHNVHNNIKVVFTTAYDKYAVESINYHPFGYLLKPISASQLKEVICHIVNDQKSQITNQDFAGSFKTKLKVSSKQEVRYIDYDDIFYLRADGNYTKLILITSELINITQQLGKVEKELPKKIFYRINRSEIINIKHIKTLKRKEQQIVLKAYQKVLFLKVSKNKLAKVEKQISL